LGDDRAHPGSLWWFLDEEKAVAQYEALREAQGDDSLYVPIKVHLEILLGGSGGVAPLKQTSPDSKP
jgi:hypothetical protein